MRICQVISEGIVCRWRGVRENEVIILVFLNAVPDIAAMEVKVLVVEQQCNGNG